MSRENPNYETRYWMRVWIVFKSLGLAWRRLPRVLVCLWDELLEVWPRLFEVVLVLAAPLFVLFSPLLVLWIDKDNERRWKERERAKQEHIDAIKGNRGEVDQ